MNEQKIKHLEMIENIIERMSSNSFQLKGWTVTLVGIIGGLSAQGADKRFFALVFVPLLAFWFLDSYYLQLERKYKKLYEKVLSGGVAPFSMNTHEITAKSEGDSGLCFISCLFAQAEGWFYIAVGGAVLVLAFVLKVFEK